MVNGCFITMQEESATQTEAVQDLQL